MSGGLPRSSLPSRLNLSDLWIATQFGAKGAGKGMSACSTAKDPGAHQWTVAIPDREK
jgi:hypothetical protein